MSENILNELVGKRVEVWSLKGDVTYTDYGKLEAYDSQWVKLKSGDGKMLFFAIANIRLIKPLQ